MSGILLQDPFGILLQDPFGIFLQDRKYSFGYQLFMNKSCVYCILCNVGSNSAPMGHHAIVRQVQFHDDLYVTHCKFVEEMGISC